MKKYVVEVRETLVKEIVIEAEDEAKADRIARDMYQGDGLTLGDEYFCGRTTEVVRMASKRDLESHCVD